jgi:hypothetical protein
MDTWGTLEFIKSIPYKKKQIPLTLNNIPYKKKQIPLKVNNIPYKKNSILLKVNNISGVNQLIASYLTIDELVDLRSIVSLGIEEIFFIELLMLLPRYHKKITIHDNEYLIKNYMMDPYAIKYTDHQYNPLLNV